MRLIDADDLIDFLDVGHLRTTSELCYSENDVMNLLLHAPTIEAVPVVQAHWHSIYTNNLGVKVGFCSNCGYQKEVVNNFCGNCGAKMKGGVE